MRKWFVPLMVLGAGGVGAFFFTDKGRKTLRGWLAKFDDAPDRWEEWNESAQEELERIKASLNQVARSLEPHSETGH
jgi:hypothetical protein